MFWPDECSNPWSTTLEASKLTIAAAMRYLCWEYCIDFAYFYYFAIRFWKCSDCGIICFLFDNYLLITLNQRNVQLPIQSWCCEFEYRSGRGVQHYVIKFVSDRSVVSSANKTDSHDLTEILLKVVLNTIR